MNGKSIAMFNPLKDSPQIFDSRVLAICNGPLPGEKNWKVRRDNERRNLLLQHMPQDFKLRLTRALHPCKAEEATIGTLLSKMIEVCKEIKGNGVQQEQQELGNSVKSEPNEADSHNGSDNPPNLFHRLQQGPSATVLDFVCEIEEVLVRCGYPHDFGEALAKDRLVVGLRDREMRRQLNEMMDIPGGVSYEWLRFHAIRLDGGDLGYEEPPRTPPRNDLEPSHHQRSSCKGPLLPLPFNSNVPPPLPPVSCNVPPPLPPDSCNVPPPLPPASCNVPPPLPPVSCNVPPPLPPFSCNVPPPLPPVSCNVPPPLPPASCNVPPPLPPASYNVPPPLPPASCNVPPPLPPVTSNTCSPLGPAKRKRTLLPTPSSSPLPMLKKPCSRKKVHVPPPPPPVG